MLLSYEEFKVAESTKEIRNNVECDEEAYLGYLESEGSYDVCCSKKDCNC